jgi:hypothetical protein
LVAALAAGIVMLVVSLVADAVVKTAFPYDVFALGGMRAKNDPVMTLFFLHPFVLACAMTVVYSKLGGALKGDPTEKGKKFGLLVWLAVSLPSIYLVYTSKDYPVGFHITNLVGSLFYMPAAGVTIAKIMGAK